MDTQEILKKVRKVEIKTRRLSANIFAGQIHFIGFFYCRQCFFYRFRKNTITVFAVFNNKICNLRIAKYIFRKIWRSEIFV